MIVRQKISYSLFIISYFLFFSIIPIQADEIANMGKNIGSKWENIVVKIKIVMKQKVIVQGKEVSNSENKAEIRGTVIDSTGLVAASLTDTDPFSYIENITRSMPGNEHVKYESNITDIKIRFSKENEVDANIVLRDKDKDLAFIRPKNKLKDPVKFIDLKDSVPVELLDQIIILDKLPKVANETIGIIVDRIGAVSTKPRLIYVPTAEDIEKGLPVFSLEKGKLIGIMVLRMGENPTISMSLSKPRDIESLNIILPASEILEIASQVTPY